MASPSRSGSAARIDIVDLLGRLLKLRDQLLLAVDHLIDGFEVVIPRPPRGSFLGRSFTWPKEALTTYVLPRYLPMRFRLRRRFDDDEILLP